MCQYQQKKILPFGKLMPTKKLMKKKTNQLINYQKLQFLEVYLEAK